jgi:hypothetical protein
MSVRQELEVQLAEIPGLERRRSRHGDSFSYFLADREIAHFHGDGRMDLRLTKERIRELRADGAIAPRVKVGGPSANWVAIRLASARDIALAMSLIDEAIRANS